MPADFALATTLLGSGGSGITAGQAAQLIAQGVREANEQLARTAPRRRAGRASASSRSSNCTSIARAKRGTRCRRSRRRDAPLHGRTDDRAGHRRAAPAPGRRLPRRRLRLHQRAHREDRRRAESIVYTVNTKRARSEVRPQPTQVELVRNLVRTASNNANTDAQIGHTLFNLLVPVDLEPFMGSSTETVLELDESTAAHPLGGARAIRVERKVEQAIKSRGRSARSCLRKLRHGRRARGRHGRFGRRQHSRDRRSRMRPVDLSAADGRAAGGEDGRGMPGEIDRPPQIVPVISGPRPGDEEPDARTVINAVMNGPWRIVHIAGHGEPPISRVHRPRGVVLSGGSFFGAAGNQRAARHPRARVRQLLPSGGGRSEDLFKPVNYDRARIRLRRGACADQGRRTLRHRGRLGGGRRRGERVRRELLQGAARRRRFIDAVAAAGKTRANAAAATPGRRTSATAIRTGGSGRRPATRKAPPRPAGQEFAEHRVGPGADRRARADRRRKRVPGQEARRSSRPPALPGSRSSARTGKAAATSRKHLATHGREPGTSRKRSPGISARGSAQDGTASFASIEQLANARIRLAWERADRDGKADRSGAKGHQGCDERCSTA